MSPTFQSYFTTNAPPLQDLLPLHSVNETDARNIKLWTGCFEYNIIIAGTLSLLITRNGTRLENTSPSTGGSEVPAYDKCYILATDIYIVVFRAVCIRIYYAVLIATPETVRVLTGSRILTAVYIYILAMQ